MLWKLGAPDRRQTKNKYLCVGNLKMPGVQSFSTLVLITGHTDFKGSWLPLLLEKSGKEIVNFWLSPHVFII